MLPSSRLYVKRLELDWTLPDSGLNLGPEKFDSLSLTDWAPGLWAEIGTGDFTHDLI